VADQVGQSDIAFVGRVEVSEMLDPPVRGDVYGSFERRYELVVDHAVKGVRTGDRVVMFGDSSVTSCGSSELEEAVKVRAIFGSNVDGRFVADSTPPCSAAPTVEELLAADLTLPARFWTVALRITTTSWPCS
jgi:hypothetical protein